MATTNPPSQPITLSPALPQDYYTISEIECHTFFFDPFSAIAWGPLRASSPAISARAAQFISSNTNPDDRRFCTKATILTPSGKEEIVGFAEWKFITNRPTEPKVAVVKESVDETKTAEQIFAEKEKSWGVGANFRFCEDVFLTADEYMIDSCGGRDYCKLTTLAVSPSYQRRGIGTMLLKAGLKEADELGLQTVLAASPVGEGLYRRFGFEEVVMMQLQLWEYEGGEELVGEDRVVSHCIMRRPGRLEVMLETK